MNKLSSEQIKSLEELKFDWNPLQSKWEEMFSVLCKFKTLHNHCNVPKNYPENSSLYTWVTFQRRLKRKDGLTQERIEKLSNLGFNWNPIQESLEKILTALSEFKKINGHCNVQKIHLDYSVLRTSLDNSLLGTWVNNQRQKHKNLRLSQDIIEKLEAIDFNWNPLSTAWEKMFVGLNEFKQANGHCNVPSTYSKDKQLASWVVRQRTQYKSNKLKMDRITRLNEIGFIFEPECISWENMFSELCNYRNENNHCNVPQKFLRNPMLGRWVATQRQSYRKNMLSYERVDKLEKIGFEWKP